MSDEQALQIASALGAAEVHLVRSTGAPDVSVEEVAPDRTHRGGHRPDHRHHRPVSMTERRRARIEPAVALGSSARSWAGELMSYAKDHPGVRVVGTILSSADAMELGYDVLILDDTSSFLTPRLIDRLQRSDRAVIGVYDPETGRSGSVPAARDGG